MKSQEKQVYGMTEKIFLYLCIKKKTDMFQSLYLVVFLVVQIMMIPNQEKQVGEMDMVQNLQICFQKSLVLKYAATSQKKYILKRGVITCVLDKNL